MLQRRYHLLRALRVRPHTPEQVSRVWLILSSAPSSDLGDCPICNKRVPLASINEHVDDHLDLSIKVPATPPKNKGKQKQEWSKFFQGAGRSPSGPSKNKGKTKYVFVTAFVSFCSSPCLHRSPEEILGEPLPRLAYDTLKLKRLRELLEEHNLSTAGDRPVLAARHAQWVNMYNANLDAAPGARKNQKQLRWELQQWDEVEERRRAKGKVHKDLDPQAYQVCGGILFIGGGLTAFHRGRIGRLSRVLSRSRSRSVQKRRRKQQTVALQSSSQDPKARRETDMTRAPKTAISTSRDTPTVLHQAWLISTWGLMRNERPCNKVSSSHRPRCRLEQRCEPNLPRTPESPSKARNLIYQQLHIQNSVRRRHV